MPMTFFEQMVRCIGAGHLVGVDREKLCGGGSEDDGAGSVLCGAE